MAGFGFVMFIFVLVFLGFVGFAIYFFFKILQFVLQATSLYKRMIQRQETIIKLLYDLREISQGSNQHKSNVSDKTETANIMNELGIDDVEDYESSHQNIELNENIRPTEVNENIRLIESETSEIKKVLPNLEWVEPSPYKFFALTKHDGDYDIVQVGGYKPKVINKDKLYEIPQVRKWMQNYLNEM